MSDDKDEGMEKIVGAQFVDIDERCFEAGVIYTPFIPLQVSHVNLPDGTVTPEGERADPLVPRCATPDDLFDAVTPGEPRWYWFAQATGYVAARVVRDGSGTLWLDLPLGSRRLEPGDVPLCRGRALDPEAVAALRQETDRLDKRLTAARLVLDRAGVPDVWLYTDAERAAYKTDSGAMIPLADRIALVVAERDAVRQHMQRTCCCRVDAALEHADDVTKALGPPEAPPEDAVRGVAGDRCEPGNECGRCGCPNCQD